ncbi:MAG: Holliday junction resolvase RuvX [Candidatus Moraniibacteriota bacterium]
MEHGKNYLGLDWGATNIGVALAHNETGVALPFMTVPNDKNTMAVLSDIIVSENIGTVIIGMPSYEHQEEKEHPGETLGKLLIEQCSVKVEYQNEMFTTKMAQANLLEQGIKHSSKNNDEEAARIILEGWLGKRSL